MNNVSVPELLARLPKNETIYYRPNPGNAGDALIAAGAFILFDQAGLKIEIINSDDFNSEGKIVIYAGGGNLVGIYSDAKDFISKHHKHAKHLILLPHTVSNNDELLAELQSNVTLFARELVTHEYLLANAKNANVYLNQDLAFYIDSNAMLELAKLTLTGALLKKIFFKFTHNKIAYKNTPQPSVMMRYTKFEDDRLSASRKSANFFRTDAEKALKHTPDDNMDLSNLYEGATSHKEICFYTVGRLMSFINKFETINTDRLHICIASALLGKKVNFYANSYFKCKAIYEFSLKENFKSVNWCGTKVDGNIALDC